VADPAEAKATVAAGGAATGLTLVFIGDHGPATQVSLGPVSVATTLRF